MCMFCGWGIFPWLALSTCNQRHEHYHEEHIHGTSAEEGRAVEILKERFAKGEITKEQFLEMRKIIEN